RRLHRALLRFSGKTRRTMGNRAAAADLRERSHRPRRSRKEAAIGYKDLARFPQGYRHLAYLQTAIGYKVKADMPGLSGPAVEALYARGKRWLGRLGGELLRFRRTRQNLSF